MTPALGSKKGSDPRDTDAGASQEDGPRHRVQPRGGAGLGGKAGSGHGRGTPAAPAPPHRPKLVTRRNVHKKTEAIGGICIEPSIATAPWWM
jgi:hypothetical protein